MRVVLGGGVAASKALRQALQEALPANGELYYPSMRFATDNGAMIARTALFHYQQGARADLSVTARADMKFPGLVSL
jgi:N6-L-threonylcarbamoyladenine synthase